MRGKTSVRAKHLQKAGWIVVAEYRDPGERHRLVLRHPHGRQFPRTEDDPRGTEVEVEAATRPRAYLQAERLLLAKEGRRVRSVME